MHPPGMPTDLSWLSLSRKVRFSVLGSVDPTREAEMAASRTLLREAGLSSSGGGAHPSRCCSSSPGKGKQGADNKQKTTHVKNLNPKKLFFFNINFSYLQ